MQIVCSSSVTCGEEAFSTLGHVRLVSESALSASDLHGTDMLITRSKVKVNRDLLAGSPVKFYGTATAGTDHVDFPALAKLDIHATSAPGCNSRAVGEYVLSALLELATTRAYSLKGKTLGLVGHGNAGSATEKLAKALGLAILKNDPPKAVHHPEGYVSLDEVLAESDIVSLHVPLVEEDPWPTRNLIAKEQIQKMQPGSVIINASRGEVLDSSATVAALDSGHLSDAVIDVWAPGIDRALMSRAFLVSPHIAGHSYEGKINGTISLYKQACEFFSLEPGWDHTSKSTSCVGRLKGAAGSEQELLKVTRKAYDIRQDSEMFREALDRDDAGRVSLFKELRSQYACRHEFHRYELVCSSPDAALFTKLGFKVVSN